MIAKLCLSWVCMVMLAAGPALAASDETAAGGEEPAVARAEGSAMSPAKKEPFAEETGEEKEEEVADPWESANRRFFTFNDRLYFWFFKPVAQGYSMIVPEPLRVCVRNFFSNVRMPRRVINCFLQGRMDAAGIELGRFAINSTLGVFGLADAAKKVFDIDEQNEDFGQTLAFHGMDSGAYVNLPFFGPLNVRDTAGLAGDVLLDPLVWVVTPYGAAAAVRGGEWVNGVSLNIGEYEAIKRAAIDPYVAVRDAYYQYRENQIRK